MIKAFSVRASKEGLVKDLASDLNAKLNQLQCDGWKILSVASTQCKEWDYPKYFDSTLFTIVAEHDDEIEEEI